MSNLVLPTLPGMAFPVAKSPTWRVKTQEATSGLEVRIGYWSFPRWKWSLTYSVLRNTVALNELWQLVDFFNAHGGPYDSWLFNDPDDNSVTDMQFGTGDGTTTQFQLMRTKNIFAEPIKNLNGAVTNIKKAGVLQAVGTNYTVGTTGIVTFVTAPANGAALTWTGSYYWRCRFLDDTIQPTKFVKLLWELGKLEFISVK